MYTTMDIIKNFMHDAADAKSTILRLPQLIHTLDIYFSETDYNIVISIVAYLMYDKKKHTLDYAIQNNNKDIVIYIIKYNLASFSKSELYGGWEPVGLYADIAKVIEYTLNNKHYDVLIYFIDTFNITDYDGMILKEASDDIKIVKYILSRGNAMMAWCIKDAFICAASNGCLDVIEYLIECGMRTHICESTKYAMLKRAALHDHLNVVKYLIDNINMEDVLRYAIEGNSLSIVIYLVSNHIIKVSKNMFRAAINRGCIDVVEYLEKHYKGGNIRLSSSILIEFIDDRKTKMVKYLIDRGANLHVEYEYVIKKAAEHGDLDMVKYLVNEGANFHIDGECTLRWAVREGHINIVKYLVRRGADIHAEKDDALMLAIKYGHVDIVKYLIKAGADVHAREEHALDLAKEYNHQDIAKILLKHGANPNKRKVPRYDKVRTVYIFE